MSAYAENIGVVNLSTLASSAQVSLMTQAVQAQMRQHVAPAWGTNPATVNYYTALNKVPAGYWKVVVYNDSDQEGALGYHDEDGGGNVFGRVFVRDTLNAGGDLLYSNLSVCSVLSHEILEIFGDPYVNKWANDDFGIVAYEFCDPVESDSYHIAIPGQRQSPTVSNFVTPQYFDNAAPFGAQFDFLRRLGSPFSVDNGGYMIFVGFSETAPADKPGTKIVDLSKLAPGTRASMRCGINFPDWKLDAKSHAAARMIRRIKSVAPVQKATP